MSHDDSSQGSFGQGAWVRAVDVSGGDVAAVLEDRFVPSGSRVVECHSGAAVDLSRYEQLDPAERELVAKAVDRRKADFGDARWCAHQALAAFDADQVIVRDERGMPLFPQGMVGSLTHTQGFRAALVGSTMQWRSLGIDAEPAAPLPGGVLESIASAAEQRSIRRAEREHGLQYLDTVLFSAKETTYKAWYPLAKRFLDFDEAAVTIFPDGRFISSILTRPSPVPCIEGRWSVSGGFVITVAGVPAGMSL